MYCHNCGSIIAAQAVICVKCGVATGQAGAGLVATGRYDAGGGAVKSTSRTLYVLLGIFMGGAGIHNFVAGYVGRGIAQLLIWFVCIGVIMESDEMAWVIIPLGIWNLIEVCVVKEDAKGVPFS